MINKKHKDQLVESALVDLWCVYFRCKFQLRRMVQEQRLELIGINWLMVEKNQRYVQWSLVEMGIFNMAETCFDHPSINENAIECPGEECDPVYFRNQDTLPMCLASVTQGNSL